MIVNATHAWFNRDALDQARRDAAMQGISLVSVLQTRSGLDAWTFTQALAAAFECPAWSMAELQSAEPCFTPFSFADMAGRNCIVLHGPQGRRQLVTADPFDADLEAWAEAGLGGPVMFGLAHPDDLAALLAQLEQKLRAVDDLVRPESQADTVDAVQDLSLVRINENQNPVVRLVDSSLYDALKAGASDVHLECDGDGLAVKYRVDGVLVPVTSVRGSDMAEQVISRIKVLAELDIAERRIPQDGRFKLRVQGREVDFRVSIMPNIFGEDAVLRLLDRRTLTESAQSLRLSHLGLDDDALAAMRYLSNRPHGMLLVTGPTGSGKTTTLYAAITEINTGRDKIITIEDPVEYRLPQVLQIPVNEKKGLSFAKGLRSILRHDPDKIMVGEIRDGETAQIAVQAALTGHLVFTTVHANNVFDVLSRFTHMGVDPYSFSAALNGIVAQRLLRLICRQCAEPVMPASLHLDAYGLTPTEVAGWRLHVGRGCGHCRGTGYKGRRAVATVLTLDDNLRAMIAAKAPILDLKQAAATGGMRDMRAAALALVARGETTLAEVNRVVA